MPITILTLVLRYGRQLLDLIGEGQTASDVWKVISAKPWVPILLKLLDPIVLIVGIGLIVWALRDLKNPNALMPEPNVNLSQPSDWKVLGDRFKGVDDGGAVIARWNQDSKTKRYTSWEVMGGSIVLSTLCTEMCKEACRRFSDSQILTQKFPEIAEIKDDGERWLVAIRQILEMGKVQGNTVSVQEGKRWESEHGQVSNLTGSSQVLCSRLFNEENGAKVEDALPQTTATNRRENTLEQHHPSFAGYPKLRTVKEIIYRGSGEERKAVFEDRPKLFLDYSPVAAAYALTDSGLFLKNDGGTAHNISFKPEIRYGFTLHFDNPIGAIEKGSSCPIEVRFCSLDKDGRKIPMGGIRSQQVESLLSSLAEEGENSFSIRIDCEDFGRNPFSSCSRLRYDSAFEKIWVELC